jgi:hypothetical protein
VSRLQTRIEQLERTLGRCRDCRTVVELVQDGSRRQPAPIQYCRTCSQPLERIAVRLSFDPNAGEP